MQEKTINVSVKQNNKYKVIAIILVLMASLAAAVYIVTQKSHTRSQAAITETKAQPTIEQPTVDSSSDYSEPLPEFPSDDTLNQEIQLIK